MWTTIVALVSIIVRHFAKRHIRHLVMVSITQNITQMQFDALNLNLKNQLFLKLCFSFPVEVIQSRSKIITAL